MSSDQPNPPTDDDEIIDRIFESLPGLDDTETAQTAIEQMGQLFESFKRRADADVAAARAAQQQAEIEAARVEERAANAVSFKDDEARRHTDELRRLEKAYEDSIAALTTASAAHEARAERAEAEAARLREELADRR